MNTANNLRKIYSDDPSLVLLRSSEISCLEPVLKFYNPKPPILDLGCFEGEMGALLFERKSLIGMDLIEAHIMSNKKETYRSLLGGDGCKMPFKNNSLNCVFSNCVIEHIPDNSRLLSEIGRVLKKGGLFIFTVPSHNFGDFLFFSVLLGKLSLKSLKNKYIQRRNWGWHHYHCYSHENWDSRLEKAGLKQEKYLYYMSRKSMKAYDIFAHIHRFFKFINIPLSIIEKYFSAETNPGGLLLVVARKINE